MIPWFHLEGVIFTEVSGRINLGKVLSVDESIRFWVSRNMCSVTPVVTEEPDRDPDDGTRVTRKQYINDTDGTEVILYAVEGGGHTWPSGIQYLPAWIIGKTCRDIDANEVIWSFFKEPFQVEICRNHLSVNQKSVL